MAVTSLRQELGLVDAPAWPQVDMPGERYHQRFAAWAARITARHPSELFAESWAWLEADLGDLDTAERILRPLSEARSDAYSTRLRHAEVLYTRARGDDRDQAGQMFRWLATRGDEVDPGTRLHCRLRMGDVARGRAIRPSTGLRVLPTLVPALAQPLVVLAVTRDGRRHPEAAADAYRALQQTGLRGLERIAAHAQDRWWPLLALAATGLTRLGDRAETRADNGNRRALVRQYRFMLTALSALLAHRRPAPELEREIRGLHEPYLNADDTAGAGNCSVTPALALAADGDEAGSKSALSTARREYSTGRPDGLPLVSGAALLKVVARILDRHATRRGGGAPMILPAA